MIKTVRGPGGPEPEEDPTSDSVRRTETGGGADCEDDCEG